MTAERSSSRRVVRRLAFAVVFGIVVGTLSHVALCARRYYLVGALFSATRPDGSRMGFVEYTIHHDPYLAVGSLVIAFAIALWKGPGDWMEES